MPAASASDRWAPQQFSQNLFSRWACSEVKKVTSIREVTNSPNVIYHFTRPLLGPGTEIQTGFNERDKQRRKERKPGDCDNRRHRRQLMSDFEKMMQVCMGEINIGAVNA